MNQNIKIINQEELEKGQNSKFGSSPENRSIKDLIQYGFINIDKPAGPTSHEVVNTVKNILGINKAGHSGTLDPQVTGILPVGLLSSTKVLSTLLHAPKKYICNMYSNNALSRSEIAQILQNFTGSIYQVPPLKSNVVKKLRVRKIYEINILDQKDKDLLFSVTSQAGTYIRTLCKDIGRSLGRHCYMKELRRVKTGPFIENNSVSLHMLFDAWENYSETFNERELREVINPVESAVKHLPHIYVNENAISSICHGIDLKIPGIIAYSDFKINQTIAIMSPKHELIGIGMTILPSQNIEENLTGIVVHPSKIIMDRLKYPIKWKKNLK